MEIKPNCFYETRADQVVGPMERTPPPKAGEEKPRLPENYPTIWVWRAKVDGEWWHWTKDGRWYQNPESTSAHDLMREVTMPETGTWTVSDLLKAREQLDAADKKEREAAIRGMTKHRLLDLAKEATADRGLNYGKPEDNFARIANRWNVHLVNIGMMTVEEWKSGKGLTPTDVALMCGDLKIARLENTPGHQDSWVDLAGYAACGAEIALRPALVPVAEKTLAYEEGN